MPALLYVMAKAAEPGLVKTRLVPPLSAVQAAELAAAFAADTLENVATVAGIEVRLALAPDAAARSAGDPVVRAAAGLGLAVEGQGDGDLGQRMARLVRRGRGRPVILVGSDSPDLPAATIGAALAALDENDAAVAPAYDGGYVLVGAARPLDGLFDIDVPWSGPRVFEATRDSLTRLGHRFAVLDAWDDVDDAAALGRLAVRLGKQSAYARTAGRIAPRTARLLERWEREGVRF